MYTDSIKKVLIIKKDILQTIKIIYPIFFVLMVITAFLPAVEHNSEDVFRPVPVGIYTAAAIPFFLISIWALYKFRINYAFILGVLGIVIMIIYIPLSNNVLDRVKEVGDKGSLGIGYYLTFIPFIALMPIIVILFTYRNEIQCKRCENIFTKDQIIKCDECGENICQNCLDSEYNVCKKCKTKHIMRLKLAEQSKPVQQQSQQVIVQQAASPQIEMKHCIHCGKLIKSNAKFCDDCGGDQ